MRALSLVLASVALIGAAPAFPAPPTRQGEDPSIIVTGHRNPEKERKEFVRALTSLQFGGRIARFEQAVCPAAIGLPPVQAAALVGRIRTVAQAVGVSVGGEKCHPNVVVIVPDNKQVFLQDLVKRHGEYFGSLSSGQIRAVLRSPGPAAAWQLEGPPISARGTELRFDEVMGTYVNNTTESASRINVGARPQFDGAVVVVERSALDGLTVTQLADYAAMRAFAAVDPVRVQSTSTPTILKVLEAPVDAQVPLSLTSWDLGLLRGLYSAPRNLESDAQRSAIRRAMEKEVEHDRPSPPPGGSR